jgi:hypothetical protein
VAWLRASLKAHWGYWRWAIAVAVVALSSGVGVPLYNSGRIDHCRSNVDLGASTTTEECLSSGGEIYSTGGNGWGVLVALLGVSVLSWLVPLLVGRHVRPPSSRPPRPLALHPGESAVSPRTWWSSKGGVVWDEAAWWCHHDHYCYWLDAERNVWVRGPRAPLHQGYGNLSLWRDSSA